MRSCPALSSRRDRSSSAGKGAVSAHPVPPSGPTDPTRGSPEHPAVPSRDASTGCFGLAHTRWGQGHTALGASPGWLLPISQPGASSSAGIQQNPRGNSRHFPLRRCWVLPPASPSQTALMPRPIPAVADARRAPCSEQVPAAERGIGELFSRGSSCCLAAPRGAGSSPAPAEPRPPQSRLCLRVPDVFIPLSALQAGHGLQGHGHTLAVQTAAAAPGNEYPSCFPLSLASSERSLLISWGWITRYMMDQILSAVNLGWNPSGTGSPYL